MTLLCLLMFRKPTDDLHHLDDCYIKYVHDGVLDHTPFAERVNTLNKRVGMVDVIKHDRFLQSLFNSFSFYYQCALNYTYKKVTCYM